MTSLYPTTTQEQFTGIDRLTAENQRLQDELSPQQIQMQQLLTAFEEVLAAKQRPESQLAEAQETIVQLLTENERLTTDLNDLKQAPFKSRRRASTNRTNTTSSHRGRHPGQGRRRPERIDQTERVEIGDTCPDCGTALTGETQVRSRVVEDIDRSALPSSPATRLSGVGVFTVGPTRRTRSRPPCPDIGWACI